MATALMAVVPLVMVGAAEALTFQRVASAEVTQAAARTLGSQPGATRAVSVAGTRITARPGFALYTGQRPGSVVVLETDENKPTVTISNAEYWRKFDGKLVVIIACACKGQAEDDCVFQQWNGTEPVVSSCGGESCCQLFQLGIDQETGDHFTLPG
jgi:hypothetical protein